MEVEVVDIEQERQRGEAEADRSALVAALMREREGYERRGEAARVAPSIPNFSGSRKRPNRR